MSEPITLDYYYGLEAEQYTFFRIPKILFNPTYKTCLLYTPDAADEL